MNKMPDDNPLVKKRREFFGDGLWADVLNHPDDPVEPFFSWICCEVCCNPQGGDRYNIEGFVSLEKAQEKNSCDNHYELTVCVDCYLIAMN